MYRETRGERGFVLYSSARYGRSTIIFITHADLKNSKNHNRNLIAALDLPPAKESMNRLAPEIQIIICECLLESATNSLKQFSNPEGRDAAKDLASFDEEAQTLLNLSQASKHWRTVSHPALEQMGNMILHYGLKPAPWQIAEASDKKKKQDSSQQPGSQGVLRTVQFPRDQRLAKNKRISVHTSTPSSNYHHVIDPGL
ncbi:uncharacterized protein KY384_000861 [Bacidia gigantensis]|uniref:uncharacterized protein n=1 Tax=Bacidia gigantensis TaxID=2732470 RepID=UPI001D055F54|nr:uncharacterized protein KY384_000861 [Bacidia gigantensis]KAG8534019.1 hypothetical protein KY384_000861 [Bacidia gigantensis]